MKITDIKKYADDLGVTYAGLRKDELIRAIQIAEGNNACFGRKTETCPYDDCLWMNDCRRHSRKQING